MQDIFIILIIAVSLSMDTFSLSLAYGMLKLKNSIIKQISITVGIFHFFMPLFGDFLGEYILSIINIKSTLIVGIVFLLLAIELLFSYFKEESVTNVDTFFKIITFALTVSLDSFSVGIGFSAITKYHILASFMFMIVSFCFTFLGLKMGTKLNDVLGKNAQILGIALLFILSINYIFK